MERHGLDLPVSVNAVMNFGSHEMREGLSASQKRTLLHGVSDLQGEHKVFP